jgi:hypothetical protein
MKRREEMGTSERGSEKPHDENDNVRERKWRKGKGRNRRRRRERLSGVRVWNDQDGKTLGHDTGN